MGESRISSYYDKIIEVTQRDDGNDANHSAAFVSMQGHNLGRKTKLVLKRGTY